MARLPYLKRPLPYARMSSAPQTVDQHTLLAMHDSVKDAARNGIVAPHELGAIEHRGAIVHQGAERRTDDAVCITLYNEPLSTLRQTLEALLSSALQAQRLGRMTSLCVCIVADGAEREDSAIGRFFRERGCEPERPANEPSTDNEFHHSRQPIAAWLPGVEDDWSLHFVLCRKQRNRGKLHSHALFFSELCALLAPRRCWQIDTGTMMEIQSFSEVIARFEANPAIGAVGCRIEIAAPGDSDGFVRRWQHMDFAGQLAIFWPSEVASGHMSVLPGQCGAFRWDALSEGEAQAPIKRYLRGLQPASRMERIMFMAEDRVIGNELVLAQHRAWRLDYAHRAGAVTDACETLPELLRQRRRWHNCSFACRLWLLGRWPAELLRDDREWRHKTRFTLAMLWQTFLALMQLLVPAFAVAGWWMWSAAIGSVWHQHHEALAIATLSSVGMAIGLAIAPLRRVGGVARDSVAWLALGLSLVTIGCAMPWPIAIALQGPMLMQAAMPALVLPGARWPRLRHLPEFVLFNGVFQTLLWSYALLHLGDISWGTKGLQQATVRQRTMGRYEYCVLGASLLANVGLLVLCGAWTGHLPDASNLGAAVAAGTALLLSACGVFGQFALIRRRGNAITHPTHLPSYHRASTHRWPVVARPARTTASGETR